MGSGTGRASGQRSLGDERIGLSSGKTRTGIGTGVPGPRNGVGTEDSEEGKYG